MDVDDNGIARRLSGVRAAPRLLARCVLATGGDRLAGSLMNADIKFICDVHAERLKQLDAIDSVDSALAQMTTSADASTVFESDMHGNPVMVSEGERARAPRRATAAIMDDATSPQSPV